MAAGNITAENFSSRKVCLRRAREHLTNRSYHSANRTLERGQRQWPDLGFDHEWQTLSGHVCLKRGQHKHAKSLLKQALSDGSAHIEARYVLGLNYLATGNAQAAIWHLSKIADDPDQLVPWRCHAGSALCVAYSALGMNRSSQDALENASKFELVSAQLLADEGYRLLRVGAYQEAEVQLARALQIDPTCEEAFLRLGNTLYVQGKTEGALEILAYGLEQSPEYLGFFHLIAEIYNSREQFREAAAFLKQALDASPESDDSDATSFMLSQNIARMGKTDAAIQGFSELIKNHPRSSLRQNVEARIEALEHRLDIPRDTLRNFPRRLQRRAYCAPNTLANVLRFCGVDTDQDSVAARIFRKGSSRWPDIVEFLEQVDGIAFRVFRADKESLVSCIHDNIPVITAEHHGLTGHMLAVIGMDAGADLVIAQDPRFLNAVEIPWKLFKRSWDHDDALCIAVTDESHKGKLPDISGNEKQYVEGYIKLCRLSDERQLDDVMYLAAELSELAPDAQAPLRFLAEAALQTKSVPQLREICDEALKKWPDCYWATRFLGDAAFMDDDPASATTQYRKSRKLYSSDPSLWYAEAELHLSNGRRTRGRACLLRALSMDPWMHPARRRLIRDLADNNDNDTALFHARMLVEMEPDSNKNRALMARIVGNTQVRTLADNAKRANQQAQARQDNAPTADPDTREPTADDETEVEIDLDDL